MTWRARLWWTVVAIAVAGWLWLTLVAPVAAQVAAEGTVEGMRAHLSAGRADPAP